MSMGIYYIKNIINKKEYIGSSINIENRFKRHIKELKKNIHHNILLQRSWNKYGEENFEYGIIELIQEKSQLLKIEQTYLDKLHNLLNIAPASGGDLLTKNPKKKEIIQKIKKSMIERYAKLTTQEKKEIYGQPGIKNGNYKDGLSRFKYCPKCDKNLIKKRASVCKDCRDISGISNPFYGKTHTKESLKIIGQKTKDRINNLTLEEKIKYKNFRFVKIENIVYSGVTLAAKYLGVVPGTICNRIKSKNILYDNYYYVDDEEWILNNIDKIINE